MIKEIQAKTILHYHENPIPTNWDVNIYRGCAHGCKYCFAQYSHRYLEEENFFGDIYVKLNAGKLLARDLAKKSWRGQTLNICGVTDCYQPLEAKYKLMPQVLQACIDNQNPVLIATKSSLPLRDIELIKELNRVAGVSLSSTITTPNEDKRKLLEPGASPSAERLKMLETFAAAGVRTHILLMPVIPYITDEPDELEELFAAAQKAGINGIVTDILNLRGNTKLGFYNFLRKEYPSLLSKYYALYGSESYVKAEYSSRIYKLFGELKEKYVFKTYVRPYPNPRGRVKPLIVVPAQAKRRHKKAARTPVLFNAKICVAKAKFSEPFEVKAKKAACGLKGNKSYPLFDFSDAEGNAVPQDSEQLSLFPKEK